ncbi:MAG TPA: hypothetical protein VK906_06965 [Egicoccus sp.]|nr:hypothetical protein [Egicoccus sp.]HSK22896.1 hypothetical protein [Egicoccus sp.]
MSATLPTVDDLAHSISSDLGWIQGSFEVAALLESQGITDNDAREHYGQPDVFGLADEVLARQRSEDDLQRLASEEEDRRLVDELDRYPVKTMGLIRTIIRGAAYGMPMGLTVFASLILLYSLWSYYYFTPAQATAIGLGTALSYFIAGGFTQAIGRRGLMYLRQGMYLMTLKVSWFFVLTGIAVTAVVALVLYLVFNLFTVISQFEANLAVLYFLSLSVLWLCLAVLYMLEQEVMFTVAVAIGVAVVYFLREYVGLPMVVCHQIGLAASSLFSMLMSAVHLVRLHRRHRDPAVPTYTKLPRIVILLSSVRTFVLYGSLYFTLLFADRLLAWTGRMDFRQTFIWFRADYEAGLNWALIGMLPAFTVLEIVLQRFGGQMKPKQLVHSLADRRSFSSWYLRFYVRQVGLYLVVAIAGVVAAWYGMLALVPRIPELAILEGHVTRFTFFVGAFGYLAIGFSLLNLSVFFWLSRPRLAMLSLLPAMVGNLVVGYLLSRMFSYHLAVFGLAAGGLVFAFISTVLCMRVMSNLDYYYYSAF